jgi:multiple sugar transport system permease protein
MMAASAAMIAPVIVLFFFAQRYFMRGIVTTGLAGR